ncbi:hypothetical protein [Methanobacterium spitsbergense]|uniref:DUF1565 domain-containing protein n=1 Tax=Methanobacterium spitsbergense TaxID=2874285 RepID=A0A8T5UV29_9EURY|nr:hypothetical protein [Methanobacterium spitsbergense]MBZ2164509.1 hypothetical protein [Methanobacterium spitsbergense]
MKIKIFGIIMTLIVMSCIFAANAESGGQDMSVIYVNPNLGNPVNMGNDHNPGNDIHAPKLTITSALDAVNNGGTIYLSNGVYTDPDMYDNYIINKNVTIIGEDKDRTIIDGLGRQYSFIRIKPNSTVNFQKITFKGNNKVVQAEGLIFNRGNTTITQCTFRENDGGFAAIYNLGILNVTHCLFINNPALCIAGANSQDHGYLIQTMGENSKCSVTYSTFINNSAYVDFIAYDSNSSINYCNFYDQGDVVAVGICTLDAKYNFWNGTPNIFTNWGGNLTWEPVSDSPF